MSFREFSKRVALVVAVGLLLAALWFLRDTLLLAFFAVVLAVGISIPSGWLQRLGLPRGPANVLSVLFVGTVALVLLLWLLPAIAVELGQLLRGLPRALENAASAYNGLREGNERLGQLLPPAQPAGSSLSEEEFRRLVDEVVSTGLPILISGGGLVVSVVSNLVLVVFIAILSLVDPTAYVTASLYLVPKTYHPRLVALWGELYLTLRTWLSALFTSITITVLLVWVILGLLGMPNVLVVAVFAGFATFVPNIGAFLPLIPITIFTLADDPAKLLIMVPAYLAIQSVESNVLSPLIVKRQLSIPAAGMFVFQIVSGLIFGILGILLAVPLLAVIVTLVRELYSRDVLGLGEDITVSLDKQRLRLEQNAVTGGKTEKAPLVEPTPPPPTVKPSSRNAKHKDRTS